MCIRDVARFVWQDELELPEEKKKKKKKKPKKHKKHASGDSKSTAEETKKEEAGSVWQWVALQLETPVLAPLHRYYAPRSCVFVYIV